jgi:hypothetical protein
MAPFDKFPETTGGQQFERMYKPMYKDVKYAKGPKHKLKQKQHPSYLTKFQTSTSDTYPQISLDHYQNPKGIMQLMSLWTENRNRLTSSKPTWNYHH